jgi:hypothetical protein
MHGVGTDRGTVGAYGRIDYKVKVGAGGLTGRTDLTDLLTLGYSLTYRNAHGIHKRNSSCQNP